MYTYGVDADSVRARRLAAQQTVNDTALEAAVDEAASELNSLMLSIGVNPETVTQADYPENFGWCAITVELGAAAYYLRTVTGTADVSFREEYERRMALLRKNPNMLVVYNATATSQQTARTRANHTPTGADPGANQRARARFLDPSNRRSWHQ